MYHRPIIPLLAALMAGILIGSRFSGRMTPAFGVILVSGIFLFLSAAKNRCCITAPLLIFLAVGCLSIQPWVSPRFSPDHIVHLQNRPGLGVEGTIERIDIVEDNRLRCILKIARVDSGAGATDAAGRIRLTIIGRDLSFSPGDAIRFQGSIKPFRNFNNPGGFDYKRHMQFQRVHGTAYALSEKVKVLEKGREDGFRSRVEKARHRISGFIEAHADRSSRGILKALVVGDRTDIPPETALSFYRAGVGHILAISGLHVGIVATVSFSLFRWLLSFSRSILWAAWTRKAAAALSLFPVWVYALLAGMSPSTQRAVIMVSIFLLSYLLEKRQDIINTLAAAALLVLIVDPPSLFSISFQLSFTAVLSIVLGIGLISPAGKKDASAGLLSKALHRLILFFAVSFFASLGTLPLVMRYFNEVSLVGLAGNLIAIPLIGFGVVPLGLLSAFVYPISASAAAIGIDSASGLTAFSLPAISFLSDLPFAAVKAVTPSVVEILCFYTIAGAVVFRLKNRKPLLHLIHAAAVIAFLVLGIDVLYWVHQRFMRREIRVTAVDVGQGNAALIQLPGKEVLLVDGGGFSDPAVFDVGARVVAPVLWSRKIRTVDRLILTHPDSDHLNGLLFIAEHFDVDSIWSNGEPAESQSYSGFGEIIERHRISAPKFETLARVHRLDDVEIKILYPPADFIERKRREKWRTTNDNSLVVRIGLGSVSFLFPGDITEKAEEELVSLYGDSLRSTVLFSPHHGSPRSSTPAFLDRVSPEIVIVSSGGRYRTGLSHDSVLRRYRDRGCRIYETSRHGAVMLESDGRKLTVRPFLDAGEAGHLFKTGN
ncbi:MAG: DNA internalization-related competence protein ComEC/Rec2 [Desulfobacteraceae bacterium]|nr:MAG: DNA internalization-related competence protein ComEC/Rec2 [Desulfobacteraceae bacterium]